MSNRIWSISVAFACVLCASTGFAQRQPVSGFERHYMEGLQRQVEAQGITQARLDDMGNLIATFGRGKPHLLITTAVDVDGWMVSDITSDGYLRLHRNTTGATFRLFDQFLYGHQVVITTSSGRPVSGVVGSVSAHLQRGREAATAPKGLDDMWVDVGAESAAEVRALGIQLLDPVAAAREPTTYPGDTGPGAQTEWSVSALSSLVPLVASFEQSNRLTGTVTIALATQGAFGQRGAARLVRELPRPDRVIVVTTLSVGQGSDPRGALGRLGDGPVIWETSASLIDAARRETLRFQLLASAAPKPAVWSTAEVVSLPVLFAQTPAEMVRWRDSVELRRLLAAVIGVPVPSAPEGIGGSYGGPPYPTGLAAPFKHLLPLAQAYGVSGHETAVRQAVEKRLPKWAKPMVDAKGNLTVSFGEGGQELLFVAHTDELGCEITEIRDDGTAGVRRCGVFNASMEAHPVFVHTDTAIVPAVMAPRPNYMTAKEWQPKPEEMSVYFGTDSRAATETLGVKPGDTVTVRKRFQRLGPHRATARSIDDRAGCAALLSALERIDPTRVKNRVTFAWDVEEETGLVGAGVLAERMHPDYVFPVDTFVSSDTPIDPQRYAHIPLGSGAVLRAADSSSITPPDLVAKVKAMAESHQIPVSVGTTSGGNDGSQFTKVGSQVMPLSWPGRYSHSAVEVIDGRDLKALEDLIVVLTTEWK